MQKKLPITPAMLELFNNCVEFGMDNGIHFAIVKTQLERDQYDEVANMFKNMKGKWNARRKRTEFMPGYNPVEMMSTADQGYLTIEKDDYFPTPEPVIKRMFELADIRETDSVLEPSAGTGAIAKYLVEHNIPQENIDVIEFNSTRREILRQAGFRVVGDDFLKYSEENLYDCIMANPPFGNLQDEKHVMKMMHHLKPKGILVAVVGAGFAFRKEYEQLKNLIHHAEKLPEDSFKDSGTNIDTYLIVFRNDPEAIRNDISGVASPAVTREAMSEPEYESPESILAELFREMNEFNSCMVGLAKELGMSNVDIPLMPMNIGANLSTSNPKSGGRKQKAPLTGTSSVTSGQMSLFA